MILNESQLREVLRTKPQSKLITEAVKHQNRILLHTASEVNANNSNPYAQDFLGWVKSLLPYDKFQRFKQLLRTPYTTVGISNEIFTEFSRIFEGQNPYFNYEFKSSNDSEDWNLYLKDNLRNRDFFAHKGFEQLKYSINSILVVDLPLEQKTSKPEPYYYFLQIENVIHVEINHKGDIETLIFNIGKEKIAVYDEQSYRVFKIDGEIITLEIENFHDLNYCPATFFWDWNLRKDTQLIKKSPFTDLLSDLDKYLALDTFKEHADLYSSFPIVVSIEEDCGFDGCESGYITTTTSFNNIKTEKWEDVVTSTKCPSCSERALIGAGTNFQIPAKVMEGTMNKAVEIVSADVKPLEYLSSKINILGNNIKQKIIGNQNKAIDSQAVNELQVLGSFEGKLNTLNKIKRQFERVEKFGNDTVALLRYGNSFVSSTVFYGDEFYLKSIKVLQEEYKTAKQNGEPDDEIDAIYRKIIVYKYKGNTEKIDRAWILLNLNPEPHKTVEQTKELFLSSAIDKTDYVIKARFNNFIARFEREQTNVVTFGDNLNFNTKIKTIYLELINYALEGLESESTTNPLKELVGGVSAIVDVSKSVSTGEISKESAVAILVNMFEFKEEIAFKMVNNIVDKNLNKPRF